MNCKGSLTPAFLSAKRKMKILLPCNNNGDCSAIKKDKEFITTKTKRPRHLCGCARVRTSVACASWPACVRLCAPPFPAAVSSDRGARREIGLSIKKMAALGELGCGWASAALRAAAARWRTRDARWPGRTSQVSWAPVAFYGLFPLL